MRLNRHSTAARRTAPLVTFICNGCETIENTRTSALPKHWTMKESRREPEVYCDLCTETAENRKLLGRRQ